MPLSLTLKVCLRYQNLPKTKRKNNHFRTRPLADGGDPGDPGQNGSRLLLLAVTGKFPLCLPHHLKSPYTTGTRSWTGWTDS